jgi:hypothetical protein
MNLRSEIAVLFVAALFGVTIGVVYAFVIPALFPGFRTSWILNLGVLVAALIGGYIGYHVPTANTPLVKIILGFTYAAVTVILVYFLSLLIIVNVRGE